MNHLGINSHVLSYTVYGHIVALKSCREVDDNCTITVIY